MDANNQNINQNQQQTQQTNGLSQQPPQTQPAPNFQESPAQKVLKTGGMALAFMSMVASFVAIFKNIFSKK